ncbi:MAG: SIMPL domain-containing protein, partial [Planctomycetaceae bacterium]
MQRLMTVLILGTLAALLAAPLRAEEEELAAMISVTGEGRAAAPPDMATINTGVVTQAETAQEALTQNNEAMQKLLDVLKQHDVAEKDVQTSSFNVHPVYKHDERGRTEPQVAGYRVQNQVQVRVRNLAGLGDVLDAL